jgi:hypothetical protein
MNADTTVGTAHRQRGRWAVRARAAVAMTLLVLGATLHAADATPDNAGNLSKGGFVAACTGVAGTVATKGTVVKCRFPNGTSESCTFKNTQTVTCNDIPLVVGEASGTHGPLTGGERDAGLSTGTTGTSTIPLGGVLTTDDDTR